MIAGDFADVSWLSHRAGWPLDMAAERYSESYHGDYRTWQDAIDALPPCPRANHRVVDGKVVIETDLERHVVARSARALHPWRKGPFLIGDVYIDSEWRSDWKWQRLSPHVNFHDRLVLDVGSGNGYFGWRMLDGGARQVIGVDPTLLFCMQHRLLQHFVQHPDHCILPLKLEEVPRHADFDIVLSMGVIYHRRDPLDHIRHLAALTLPGGAIVVESIVADPGFTPRQRYARMRNVWYLPSVTDLCTWMTACGLQDVRCVDVNPTTTGEQRTTDWMRFESLAQALDPNDPGRTIEGYPAPQRAIVIGSRPDI